jgi:guanylate kinase
MLGNLFIISSPSGGGKGTLIREVLRIVPNIGYSISLTTRKIRVGEEHGKHYFFVSREEFEKSIECGEFLEYAEVHGNFYGTSKGQVEKMTREGVDVILEIDVQGADLIRAKMPKAVSIFILPPSFDVLKARLVKRQTESDEELSLRLKNSRGEVEDFKDFDYVIINDEVEKATNDLKTAILAERLRKDRQIEKIETILETFEKI